MIITAKVKTQMDGVTQYVVIRHKDERIVVILRR